MPEYGFGLYIFDSKERLYLVKKPGSRHGSNGHEWLVPGDTYGTTPWDRNSQPYKERLNKILTTESPITKNIIDDERLSRYHLGCWSHNRDDGTECVFDNWVFTLREPFDVFEKDGIVENDTISESRPFDFTELPVDRMYSLTQEFLKSSLFHDSRHIPTKTNEKERKDFQELLGNDYKKYFLYKVLVPGGYGRVYVTLDIATLSPRVVKIPFADQDDNVEQVRFLREGEALLSLIHNRVTNIEEIFSINRIENYRYYLLKEYIRGDNLQKSWHKVDESHIKAIIGTIVETLSAVHGYGACHRDLKPNNIMIDIQEDNSCTTTLIDFGLVKYQSPGAEGTQELTTEGDRTGNPLYQSVTTFNDYKNHNLLDDYYSVLHIFYWLFKSKSFYDDYYSSTRGRKKILSIVEDCKSKYKDPFMEENAIAKFCKKQKDHSCIHYFTKFHEIIRLSYDKIYDKEEEFKYKNEFEDKEILQNQLKETTKNILAVFE